MRPVAALLILGLLAAGCSSRERLNPLDPANPTTGGRPTGFVAAAGEQSVVLSWDATSVPGIAGFRVLRLAPGDSVYRPVSDVLPPASTTLTDTGLLDGFDHAYRLYYVLPGGMLGASYAQDVATPGPLRPWIADATGGDLVRLSADGRHVAQRVPVIDGRMASAIAVDRANGRVWVAGEGQVSAYDPWVPASRVVQDGLGWVLESIAMDPAQPGAVWLAVGSDGFLGHYTSTGAAADPPVLTGMVHPMCIAVDGADGSVWVTDNAGDEVRRYTSNGALAARVRLAAPYRVDVDRLTHRAWVSCPQEGRVFCVGADGAVLDSVTTLRTPLAVAVDATRRRVWLSDYANGTVLEVDPQGTQVAAAGGLGEPRRIGLDEASGNVWVTRAAGSATLLSPAGVALRTVTGLGDPWDVVVDDVRLRSGTTASTVRQ